MEVIDDSIWNNFVDSNEVPNNILNVIIIKYKHGFDLSIREQAIFSSRIKEIEYILSKMKNK